MAPTGETSDPSTRTTGAALRAVLAAPAVVGLVVPGLLIAVDPWRRPLERPSLAIGLVMALTGAALVARSVADRARAGALRAERLVTTGLHAHCRNPLQLGLLAVLAGLAMASRSPLLGVHLVGTAVALQVKVVRRDEPRAAQSFPDAWPRYRSRVPRWFPRLLRRPSR